MKKESLRVVFITIIIILILVGAYAYFVYSNASESQSGGGSLSKSGAVTFSCSRNYKNLFITLEADFSPSDQITKYYIMNPQGAILDKGEIDKKSNHLSINKIYQGSEGTWHIEFVTTDPDETIGYTYDFTATNAQSRPRR